MPLIVKRMALAAVLMIACRLHAQTTRRAVIVGINDYTAGGRSAPQGRQWPSLSGASNDAAAMRDLLVLLYGFERRDVVVLRDQAATRAAILKSLQDLGATATKNDVVFFYFAGHGSQRKNSKSDEPDRLDETIVPADSRAGADDIRDKELRPLFNRILDRGARLTILLDNCHSGSGARGLPPEAQPRGIKPDLRDVADARDYGPRPESRGALVLAAAQDDEEAWETRGDDGAMHGAFTWAWMRALRDASDGEPAMDTFLRAQARLRNEKPFQEPVIAGTDDVREVPFLGTRRDRRDGRAVVAVERVRSDGTVVLQGGWANGLAPGTQLRAIGDVSQAALRVTALRGLAQSEARAENGRALAPAIHSGALLEVVAWSIPPSGPLRVWIPRASATPAALAATARTLAAAAAKRAVRWISDPTEVTPQHVVRAEDALALIAKLPAGQSLFVQFPAPASAVDVATDGVVQAASPADADYVLAGRWSAGRLEYAWVRPLMTRDDRRKSGLPVRTKWSSAGDRELRTALVRLRKIRSWQTLQSPPGERSAYRLSLMRERTRELVTGTALAGEESYRLGLRLVSRASTQRRFVYVFVIDSDGRGTLLFPRDGSVENRFPLALPAPPSIEIGNAFTVGEPYGIDTYFLLTCDEPLPNPSILEWDGVRAAEPHSALEELLLLTSAGTRGKNILVPAQWSLEKVVFESVSPVGR